MSVGGSASPLGAQSPFYQPKDGSFPEAAAQYGLDDDAYSTQAAFFDYDRDGDLDCFVLNHSVQEYAGFGAALPATKEKNNPAYSSHLYRNDGGKFNDISESAGLVSNVLSFGLGIAVDDFNNDGWLDIYVSNDYNEEDYFYINQADGTFKESLRACFDHVSLFSMGSDACDLNDDGWTDLITLDMLPASNERIKMTSGDDNYQKYASLVRNGFYHQNMRNMLQLNQGNGEQGHVPLFAEIGQLAGISNTDWSWSVLGADLNMDTHKDLFITNGYARDYTNMEFLSYTMQTQLNAQQSGQPVNQMEVIAQMPAIREPNKVFQQVTPLQFESVGSSWGLDQASISHGAVIADLDNDGDPDIVTANVNETAFVYENTHTQTNTAYLHIDMSKISAAKAIGARVVVVADGKRQHQTFMPARGFQSANYAPLLFALGHANQADSVLIYWADGHASVWKNIPKGQFWQPNQDDSAANLPPIATRSNALMPPIKITKLPYRHQEDVRNDFADQPLLPFMCSYGGPALATTTKDDETLVFMGGASGQPGSVLQYRDAQLLPWGNAMGIAAAAAEDIAATFTDTDNDGYDDLVVVAQQYHRTVPTQEEKPRLYRRQGNSFNLVAQAFPEDLTVSASTVLAFDANADGWDDLFIGAQGEGLNFPAPADSWLCFNNGAGIFTHCESLSLGLVTDALALDADHDGDTDLVVSRAWGTIAYIPNENGNFQVHTAQDMSDTGWWLSLSAADLDGDDLPEIIAGNLGLNHQLAVLSDNGLMMYYGAFANASQRIPLIGYTQQGVSYPFAARDELLAPLPLLKKTFTDYISYSQATLEEVVAPFQKEAQFLSAHELRSMILHFKNSEWHSTALPAEAQRSPVYASTTWNVNSDNYPDLVLAGNITHTRVRIGKIDANHGQVFMGDNKRTFTYAGDIGLRADVRQIAPMPDGSLLVGSNDSEWMRVFMPLRND
ncbi:MAG: VCBS repeat-containing protein [Saprospiraceae bacterium]